MQQKTFRQTNRQICRQTGKDTNLVFTALEEYDWTLQFLHMIYWRTFIIYMFLLRISTNQKIQIVTFKLMCISSQGSQITNTITTTPYNSTEHTPRHSLRAATISIHSLIFFKLDSRQLLELQKYRIKNVHLAQSFNFNILF